MWKAFLCSLLMVPLCGCAWMVNWMAAEPLPPMVRSIPGARTVTVTVTDSAQDGLLHTSVVSAELANFLNNRSNGPKFVSSVGASGSDASLSVSVNTLVVTQQNKPSTIQCRFRVQFSASLDRENATSHWSSPSIRGGYYVDFPGLSRPPIAEPCRQEDLQGRITYIIGDTLVGKLRGVR